MPIRSVISPTGRVGTATRELPSSEFLNGYPPNEEFNLTNGQSRDISYDCEVEFPSGGGRIIYILDESKLGIPEDGIYREPIRILADDGDCKVKVTNKGTRKVH